ncbi:MAG TPA: hypothetical protein VLA77_03610 [Candidatus Saccharimonadales bacterium]|nr:hypothetical protein [Candidatus Saccharimonadales bacterium]
MNVRKLGVAVSLFAALLYTAGCGGDVESDQDTKIPGPRVEKMVQATTTYKTVAATNSTLKFVDYEGHTYVVMMTSQDPRSVEPWFGIMLDGAGHIKANAPIQVIWPSDNPYQNFWCSRVGLTELTPSNIEQVKMVWISMVKPEHADYWTWKEGPAQLSWSCRLRHS